MNRAQLVAGLKQLSGILSAPFDDMRARDGIQALLTQHGLHFQTDTYGNTIARIRRGMPRSKLCFVASIDRPGVMIEALKGSDATARIMGEIEPSTLKGLTVRCSASGAHGKIVAIKPGKAGETPEPARCTIKLAKGSPAAVVDEVGCLDVQTFASAGTKVKMVGADNLVGAVSIVATLLHIAKHDTAAEVWGLFTRARHAGFHGSVALAVGGLVPRDLTIIGVEGHAASDEHKLGSGAALRWGDVHGPFDPRTTALIAGAGAAISDKKFTVQSTLAKEATEAGAFASFGYRTGSVGYAVKNRRHGKARFTPEEVDTRDIEALVRLLVSTATRAGAGIDDTEAYRNTLVRNSEEGRQRLRNPQGAKDEFATEY